MLAIRACMIPLWIVRRYNDRKVMFAPISSITMLAELAADSGPLSRPIKMSAIKRREGIVPTRPPILVPHLSPITVTRTTMQRANAADISGYNAANESIMARY